MSHLIDADKLIEHLKEHPFVEKTPSLEQAIKDEPIAYDVDKVVEQLEERKSLLEYARIPKSAKTAAAEAYSLAIKDVKAGGVNE